MRGLCFCLASCIVVSSAVAFASSVPSDPEWHLRITRLPEAFALFEAQGKRPGEGVLIGHPDTGTSLHPELAGARGFASPIRWDLAWDFVEDDAEPFHGWPLLRFPPHGHGTETSSLMVSPPGCPDGVPERSGCVTGVAPGAELVPYRVTNAVALWSGRRLAAAVEKAISDGVHVISISLGGVFFMPELRAALARAHGRGVIVVAASGNGTGPVVVSPASFPEVIAVGGITPDLRPWSSSAFGKKVEISAPATEVAFARTMLDQGMVQYDWGYAEGTSDATAMTAGAAALWLSYHGRDVLVAHYGGEENLVEAFRQVLKTHGVDRPEGWDTSRHGAGILNIEKLLRAPLE